MLTRYMHAVIVAVLLTCIPTRDVGAQQRPPTQPPARPGAPNPATLGERTPTPPETPQRPVTPPEPAPQQTGSAPVVPNAYASTYKPFPSRTTLIRDATILTAAGPPIEHGSILLRDGKVAAVGQTVNAPADAVVIDGTAKWVTPGIIDTHSHLGVYAAPGIESLQDGNEVTSPNTAEVSAEHSIWPQDPQFDLSLAGGVTTMQILPGSANLFGGRGVTVKNVPSRTAEGMKFPGAPYSLKMACGENPKRVYGGKGRFPSTAMGNVQGYRNAWIDAADYLRRWDDYRDKLSPHEKADPPKRDLRLGTLAAVLQGEIRNQNPCSRSDEMATMIDISHEFGFRIAMFHHASE